MYKSIIFLTICLQSCAYNARETPVNPIDTNGNGSLVSYKTDIKPIMVTYCLGIGNQSCHVLPTNQGAPGNFASYAGLKQKVENGAIANRVFSLNGMPPSYSNGPKELSAADLQTFKDWVAEGAPDN